MKSPLSSPLPALSNRSPASSQPRSVRRAVQAVFLLVTVVSALLFLENVSYLSASRGDSQLHGTGNVVTHSASDVFYIRFRPPAKVSMPRTLRPSLSLPSSCLDSHIATGGLCYNPAEPKLDVVWTWVNGSDELLHDAKTRVETSLPLDNPYRPYRPGNAWSHVRQFRDHDELRFSTRSVLAYYRSYSDRFHILTSDFRVPYTFTDGTSPLDYRLGLAPQWLEPSHEEWKDGNVTLRIKHHADIFDPYIDTVFNSYAIEAQFGHLTDISENFIYMNDDFFFFNELTPRAFYTSAYGFVFRLQSGRPVPPTEDGIEDRGQWRSLAASNHLLGDRFGFRRRPYISHQAKVASLPILHEISTIWYNQLSQTSSHPFRETQSGESDPSMMFMFNHFIIERWREGLLWSWVVGKHGGSDDGWTLATMERAWRELGGVVGDEHIDVRAGPRDTMNPSRVEDYLKKGGHEHPDSTKYIFSSLDGYPYAAFKDDTGNDWTLYYNVSDKELPQCSIDYETCFTDGGRALTSASEVFKNIAFKRNQCGDCISIALVAASGKLGLEAFLPSPDRITPGIPRPIASQSDEEQVSYLPLTDNWEDGQFALTEVIGDQRINVRQWTVKLLQRYRFVIGDTPSHFEMLERPSYLHRMIFQLRIHPEVALLCVNDDIDVNEEKTSVEFKTWAQGKWGTPSLWERLP